jgi:serine/threonine protein phosphatase 1
VDGERVDLTVATFVIGDIHGHLAALKDLLTQFESDLSDVDTVVFLGDYIDRGPDSRGCIDRILELTAATPATVVGLLGNHEEWFLRTHTDHARHSWLIGMEAFETIESYSSEAAAVLRAAAADAGSRLYLDPVELPYEVFFDAMPAAHVAFFENLQTWYRTPDAVCTHGGCDPDRGPIEDQDAQSLIWGTTGFQSHYRGPETLVYGHWHNTTLKADGRVEPFVLGHTLGIDSSRHGVLIAVRLPEGVVFQSGQTESWTLNTRAS